jgi:phage/plasmid-like protein (TIGR03299 family)
MAHMVETMAYAGQVPWHGLGVPVENNLTPQEMLDAANLNWTVEKQDLVTSTGIPVEGKSGLVRTSDNSLLDIIGTDWNPVQNIEAFEFFQDFVSNGDMEMHTAGSLDNGKMVWALAKVNDGFELFNGDSVESYLLFSNPHQYGKAIDVRFTPIRVVCNNTLTLSLGSTSSNSVKVNHKNVFNGEMVKEMLGVAHEKLENYKEMAEFLGSKRYNC